MLVMSSGPGAAAAWPGSEICGRFGGAVVRMVVLLPVCQGAVIVTSRSWAALEGRLQERPKTPSLACAGMTLTLPTTTFRSSVVCAYTSLTRDGRPVTWPV